MGFYQVRYSTRVNAKMKHSIAPLRSIAYLLTDLCMANSRLCKFVRVQKVPLNIN